MVSDLADSTRADELMLTTFLPETHDRRRMVEEMARVFSLEEGWTPAVAGVPVLSPRSMARLPLSRAWVMVRVLVRPIRVGNYRRSLKRRAKTAPSGGKSFAISQFRGRKGGGPRPRDACRARGIPANNLCPSLPGSDRGGAGAGFQPDQVGARLPWPSARTINICCPRG